MASVCEREIRVASVCVREMRVASVREREKEWRVCVCEREVKSGERVCV